MLRSGQVGHGFEAGDQALIPHRILLGIGGSHAFVAGSQKGMLHVGLEHRLDLPLDEVVDRALSPSPTKPNPTLAVLVHRKFGCHTYSSTGQRNNGWETLPRQATEDRPDTRLLGQSCCRSDPFTLFCCRPSFDRGLTQSSGLVVSLREEVTFARRILPGTDSSPATKIAYACTPEEATELFLSEQEAVQGVSSR